ncbi:MAG: 4-alpha-glucanotransferase [Blastocatellia bacterium]|nr:4-alpha-glucanotransferase [Blastocatellia bacterium]
MHFSRSCGILLHPTSLPGRFGIGDLGSEAYNFADFLAASGQSLWQVLPLGPPGFGNSPYQSYSAFAGNTYLISPEHLLGDNLLSEDDLENAPRFPADSVDFGRSVEFKNALLEKAFENFKRHAPAQAREDFHDFDQYAEGWLNDYAMFRAVKERHSGAVWNTWEPELARRDPEAMNRSRQELGDRVEAHKFFQYLFFKQWLALKAYCNSKGIKIIGDMPIFVAHDSVDVWTHPHLFKLDGDGTPTVVAGVPPDDFSDTGQLWGNPLYDWKRMQADDFEWWVERSAATLDIVDIVRMDHFRGFAACWEVPAGEETAEKGRWVETPGHELFAALKKAFEELPVIAENLGTITPDVEVLRERFGFPGMRVLQFAFGGDSRNPHLPHNYVSNTVAYTGTHDNDTTTGWFNSQPREGAIRTAEQVASERAHCLKYLDSDGSRIHWDFIRAVMASVADLAIVPLQDLLGLDSRARMNVPAIEEGNWGWRFQQGSLTDEMSDRLREMTELYGRMPER